MTHNGTELQAMTFNGQEVMTWVHNGVEVFSSNPIIFSAEYEKAADFDIHTKVSGTPHIKSAYITTAETGIIAKANFSSTVECDIGTLTPLAISNFKYVKIDYTYAHLNCKDGNYAFIFFRGGRIVRASSNYPPVTSDFISKSVVLPISSLESNSLGTVKVETSTSSTKYIANASIVVTKIVLTNEEPTE